MNDTDLYNGLMTIKMSKQVREDYKIACKRLGLNAHEEINKHCISVIGEYNKLKRDLDYKRYFERYFKQKEE